MDDFESITKAIFEHGKALDLFDDRAIAETSYVHSRILGLLFRLSKEGDSPFPARTKAEIVRLAKDEFARTVDERNQYYGFTDEQKEKAGAIYGILSDEIAEAIAGPELSAIPLEGKILEHRKRLREVFAGPVEEKPCYYYEAGLQLALFSINADSLDEPILDLGCGPEGRLVEYLRERGLAASGVDRHVDHPCEYLVASSWESFILETEAWGTVISHMAFSNHFIRHYLSNDGQDYAFAVKYREILDSLKRGGTFYYAPSLPFVEKHLDPGRYTFATRSIKPGLGVSAVTRL